MALSMFFSFFGQVIDSLSKCNQVISFLLIHCSLSVRQDMAAYLSYVDMSYPVLYSDLYRKYA